MNTITETTPLESALATIGQLAGDEIHLAKARALLRGYDARWQSEGWTTLETEVELTSPIPKVYQARVKFFTSMLFGGKLDVIAERDGRRALLDHKTTSQDVSDPASPYWQQLQVDVQVLHYLLLSWVSGRRCDDVVWDVIRKPGISPKLLSKADKTNAVARREYCGIELSSATLDYLQTNDRENAELYEARLTSDAMERPDFYYARRVIPISQREILDYANELWQHRESIQRNMIAANPVRNSGACLQYGTPCKFLGICSGYDSPDSGKWSFKEQMHGELETIEGDGRNLITPSRIKCHQTCLRKEHYQYVLGIERVDQEEREALVFGTLFHHGLRAWWDAFRKGDNGDDS